LVIWVSEIVQRTDKVLPYRLFTDYDNFLFKQGRHYRLYEKLGSRVMEVNGERGTQFAVWAPNAKEVSVIGNFNLWNPAEHLLTLDPESGIWEGFIPKIGEGSLYKYRITTSSGASLDKGDPFAFLCEEPPKTASIVYDLGHHWDDQEWIDSRPRSNSLTSPMATYEVHLGSWRRHLENNSPLDYREMGDQLPSYASEMGFTHVELLPIMEHPFYGSWGYQTTGYFAPTSRYGKPLDFMYFVERLHENKVGLFLDWVPSHFPADAHGLISFDGTCLYEYADEKKRYHPDWKSYIFDYCKGEVRSFLTSSAFFWLDKYHADGLRVDAVASMLYLDYSRKPGQWCPNMYGGKENLEALSFLRCLNEAVYSFFPNTHMIAEESTAWPMVSKPTYVGGIGFGMKWNMGWMHDALTYFSKDPIYRKYHHNLLTFSIWYAFSENFVLSLSHDEVVYGKGSLLKKMPGDNWQKFANLRLLLGYMYAHPGKKLLFMGGEFGQHDEWYHEKSLDWHLLGQDPHKGLAKWVGDLNRIHRREEALHALDFDGAGFQWVDFQDWSQSIISFIRKGREPDEQILVVCNFTPVPRYNYKVGAPFPGTWHEILNSDSREYGGSGQGNLGSVEAKNVPFRDLPCSISLTLPPLGALYLKAPPMPK
jgi:1,4-alpha-glucan branching enzyme